MIKHISQVTSLQDTWNWNKCLRNFFDINFDRSYVSKFKHREAHPSRLSQAVTRFARIWVVPVRVLSRILPTATSACGFSQSLQTKGFDSPLKQDTSSFPIVSNSNETDTATSSYIRSTLMLSFHLLLVILSGHFWKGFPIKIMCAISVCSNATAWSTSRREPPRLHCADNTRWPA
jgi:hypothetical protein